MASSINNAAWLDWVSTLMGGVSRETYTATLPPDRFYCVLDELPLHLVPQRHLRLLAGDLPSRSLIVNRSLQLTDGDRLPDTLASQPELFSRFAMQGTIAWVQDPATGVALPFWLGPKYKAVVESLVPGQRPPRPLPEETRSILAAAGILQPRELDSARNPWNEKIARLTPLFQEKGYAPLRDLIHPFHIAALRRYYRYLIRRGEITLGDGQSSRRYVSYNDPVARFFHQQITPVLSLVAGEMVKPSYVYMASYLSGAELKKHTDREQCEFSITLCLDFSPEPAQQTPWPIKLDTATGAVTVYQSLGDGLAYRGTRLPHYRDVLAEGHTSTSIFFHYVAADFKGSLS
jgi:hypothetical protein